MSERWRVGGGWQFKTNLGKKVSKTPSQPTERFRTYKEL
jgi:hypothetical protein